MVEDVRIVEKALGRVNYEISEKEAASRIFRRSLFAVSEIAAGEPFTPENVRSIRPGHGLAPKLCPRSSAIGRRKPSPAAPR